MKKLLLSASIILLSLNVFAQGPEVTSWIINTAGDLGYGNIPSNVQQVQYSTSNVYVSATCIPGYDIGPWTGNPNIPANQNFVYKITRTPQQNTGTPVATALGHTGVWSNGVSIFNAKDGMSYMNQGIWNRDALYYEGISFDTCLGHPAGNGEYHHHVNPRCLYDDTDSLNHSPIIGYAFDGFPIYGAYGYTNTNGTGPIKRMRSSFVLSAATTRTNGPAVNATYPAGCFIEDNIYSAGSGDLDEHNGRFCVTPDYPLGTYAYFVTINAALYPVYPYTPGPTYYGLVPAGNTGPGSGHNVPSEPVITYLPSGMSENRDEIIFSVYPNPANDFLGLYLSPSAVNNSKATFTNALGQKIFSLDFIQPGVTYYFNLHNVEAGIYFLNIQNGNISESRKVIVTK